MSMKIVRFGELYAMPSGNGLSRPTAVRGEGYRMIGMGELFANDIITDMEMDRVKMSEKEKKNFFVEEGDLLFARQSLVAAGAGKCSIVKQLSEPTTYESHLIRVRLEKTKCNSWYYYYLFKLQNNPIKAIINQCAQAGIRGNELIRVKVPLVELGLQNHIVSILSAYDNLIETNNKRIKALEQMAENLYKEWFVRFRFPGHETAEFENGIPKGWEEYRLGDCIQFTRGVSYLSSDIIDGDSVLLSMNNIRPYGGYLADYSRVYSGKFRNDQVVKENDLIMSITDMTQDRRIIGYVGIVSPTEKNCVICTHLMKVSSTDYNNYFLYGLFTFSGLSRYISEYATGANVLGLTASILCRIKCRFPDKKLADAYSQIVEPVYKRIHAIEKQNANLVKQRDLLLPRLMSGKLEV